MRKSVDKFTEDQKVVQKNKQYEERKIERTGPTTMKELGTHYIKQLQKTKEAENKIEFRKNQMADMILAPTLKDTAQEAMISHADDQLAKYDEKVKKQNEHRSSLQK